MCKHCPEGNGLKPLYVNGPKCSDVIRWVDYDGLQAGVFLSRSAERGSNECKPKIVVRCLVCMEVLVMDLTVTLPPSINFFNGNPWELVDHITGMTRVLVHRMRCQNVDPPLPSLECCICNDRQVNTALGCGHLFCNTCVALINECSKCRAPIAHKQPIFL